MHEQIKSNWLFEQLKILDQIFYIPDSALMNQKLVDFLKDSWAIVAGTPLCYTATPEWGLTQLMLDLADFVSSPSLKPIEALMPGLKTISIHDDYPDLTDATRESLNLILKTHTLSANKLYLLPLSLLSQLNLPPENTLIPNPYFDYQAAKNPAENGYLEPSDLLQFKNHSPRTEALFKAKEDYEKISRDQPSLLSQLQQLCANLSLNSNVSLGKEDNAGAGAYSAILTFNDFYTQLPFNQKQKIPSALKTEVELLLNLSSNSTVNQNATKNIQTCIATRKSLLVSKIAGKEALLSSIGIDPSDHSLSIKTSQADFFTAKIALNQSLNLNKYSGFSTYPLSLELLLHLQPNWCIRSMADIIVLSQFSVVQIEKLLKNHQFNQGLIKQLSTVGDLINLVTQCTHPEKLSLFFTLTKGNIAKLLPKTVNLAGLLSPLNDKQMTITLQLLIDLLMDEKNHAILLKNLLTHLPTRRSLVLEAVQDFMTTFIQNIKDLIILLPELTPQQKTFVLDSIKVPLSQMSLDRSDLISLIRELTSTQLQLFLPKVICNAQDLLQIIKGVDKNYHTKILETCAKQIQNIIRNAEDAAHIMSALDQPQREMVFNQTKTRLPQLIKNIADETKILQHLNTSQKKEITQHLKIHYPYLNIKSNPKVRVFCQALQTIHDEGKRLSQLGSISIGREALQLHASIEAQFKKLSSKKQTYAQFKINCQRAIHQAQPILEPQFGWREHLANLLLAVLGLGLIYIVGISVNKALNGNFMFFVKDSISLDKLKSNLDLQNPEPKILPRA